MFNGYNETPLISYNEFSQERVEKKLENVPKWSYGNETISQPAQTNRSTDLWPGKANFLGVPNVVKCNCTGYYSTSDSQSYQGENARHRPWLPRSFPVPINGSNDSCKLPPYQWNGLSSQSTCYTEGNLSYVQENGEKYPYYRHHQNPKTTEPNQPGVITSVKEAEYEKKKSDIQKGRQTVYNPGYKRNHCDLNGTPYSVDQPVPRLSVEPFTKAVPSNLNQNRVPSTGYRSIKESMYDTGHDVRKTCSESGIDPTTGQILMDYSSFAEVESKLFFDNTRHFDYYSRTYPEAIKRNQGHDNRKDCGMMGSTTPEMHFNPTRYKPYNNFEKLEPDCADYFQDGKTENLNVHARLPRSPLLFNDPRYADKTQNHSPYHSIQTGYKNIQYQGVNPQLRYDCPGDFQRTDLNQYRPCEEMQSCEFAPGGSFVYNPQNLQKTQEFSSSVPTDSLNSGNSKPYYLEAIRSEGIKNGTTKISPLRLLRKKKFVNVPQESSVTTMDASPGLDVRKFWSTWAEEEEENVAPTEMVVLDCQNIDPEQAKFLHLYDDPSRTVSLENIVKSTKDLNVTFEENKIPQVVETVLETVTSPVKSFKKSKSDNREKRKPETVDKWNEKKFDFLKRAEESKAAEVLRHEEEKMFETRLSVQQSVKKPENLEKISLTGENVPEALSPFDKKSRRSHSPEIEIAGDLPTCEYRRNKFLEYSEKKSTSLNGDNFLETKVKDEIYEMDDILRKMSEINVESPEVKLETKSDESKKPKQKVKKKKLESDEDKVTLETVAKPTIKFSIQKSHDLKISFKVLNSQENEEEKNTIDINDTEEKKNSTEMITLKYKSIQREGDRSEKKKPKKGLRRKKQMKAPVLKIKKSRYMQEEVKDPFAQDSINPECSALDDFQVQETVDSAKIKLTFKRHRGTFETECEVNGENIDKTEGAPISEELDLEKFRKNLKKPKKNDLLKESIESFPLSSEEQRDSCSQNVNDSDTPEFTKEDDSDIILIDKEEDKRCKVEATERKVEFSSENFEKVREISLDFINSTKSPEIETNHSTRKTEENSDLENKSTENSPGLKSPDWRENSQGSGNPSMLALVNQNCDLDNNSLLSNATPNEGLDISVGDTFPVAGNPEHCSNSQVPEDSVMIECEENSNKLGDQESVLEECLSDNVSNKVGLSSSKKNISVDDRVESDDDDFIKVEGNNFEKKKLSEEISITDPVMVELIETFGDLNEPELTHFGRENYLSTDDIKEEYDVDTAKENFYFGIKENSEDNVSADLSIKALEVECNKNLAEVELGHDKEELPEGDLALLNDPMVEDSCDVVQKVEKLPENGFSTEVLIHPLTEETIVNSKELNLEREEPSVAVQPINEMAAKDTKPFKLSGFDSDNSSRAEILRVKVIEESSPIPDLEKEVSRNPIKKVSLDSNETVETFKHEFFSSENETALPELRSFFQDPCNTSGISIIENHIQRELKDSNLVLSSDEPEPKKEHKSLTVIRQRTEFIVRKIKDRNSSERITWSRRKFSKAKSCPPEITFAYVSVEEIPLPVGPPPRESCWEAKEKLLICRRVDSPICQSPFGLNDLRNCRNPSPPGNEPTGIFPKSSKIKFSILKQNKFSKQTTVAKIRTPECQEVPNLNMKLVELSEDLDNTAAIDGISEFYECEDIPTSEDLTNGDDPEIEKVNDDKFRNIMQNCLENAKKFLSVGNLKLFSCSANDLLEIDTQSELKNNTDHISRDVLLTFCKDTNENLDLSENAHPSDIMMDFVPSDVCPEVLPVDNWPYLEEEVPSSPIKPKPDETDLLEGLEYVSDKSGRKRFVSETDFKTRNVASSKIETQRRKTIDTFSEASFGKNVKNELMRFKNEIKKNSFKCRVSLEKLAGKRLRENVDFKSPSWQPKVMLSRISKNELKKTISLEETQIKIEKPKHKHVDEVRRRKKSRFRNLHTKKKNESGRTFAQNTKLVELETNKETNEGSEIHNSVESQSNARSHRKETKHREGKKHDYPVGKREKEEERNKPREGEKKQSKSKRKNEGEEMKEKWVCEVCGFNNESERVVHIRSHPFHCQSCHLAFRAETYFIEHLTKEHKDIRNQHHCLLCELSFDTEIEYQRHLGTREHTHLESVEKNTINTLFTFLTGAPCPVLGFVEMKPEWLPNQSGTVHFYHQATPLSLALQYLKMHRLSNLKSSHSTHS